MEPDLRAIPWARRLKLRHLETFLVLESAGSITAAAERMHISQPAVSHWLADIEDVMGSPLFVRGRKLKLTAAGDHPAPPRRTDAGGRTAHRRGIEGRPLRAGRTAAGRLHSFRGALAMVPGAIATLQQRHPNTVIHVQEGTMVDLLSRLGKREFDLVVGTIDPRAHQYGFATEILMADVVRIVCRADHPLARKRKPTWLDAADCPWVLPPHNSLSRVRMEEAFSEQRLALPRPRVETVSVAAIQAHHHARPIAWRRCPGQGADFYTSLGLLARVALTPVIQFADLGVIWPEGSSNPLLAEFIASLKKQAKSAK